MERTSKQWMYVYDNGHEVYNSPVTSGQPALQSPTGTYHVFLKLHPTTFYSPWPYGSPYWYPPTHINYALEWRVGGFFLHDSWWRTVYGPGTNVWHNDPTYGWQTGTHGCITMPLKSAAWLYNWAPIGTLVQVNP
jgi:lipoprotein-anchoring transpeptidase ErfK/SrfK